MEGSRGPAVEDGGRLEAWHCVLHRGVGRAHMDEARHICYDGRRLEELHAYAPTDGGVFPLREELEQLCVCDAMAFIFIGYAIYPV